MLRWWSVLLALACFGELQAAETKINVLFIMGDDLRPELAKYGSAAITPNLDQLAARSVQFDKAYCQQAVCNPSRSSMLTGRRPDTLHLWNNGTHFRERNPDVVTLPQWFKQQGYTTRCVGKIFHNWHTAAKGDQRSWSAPEFLFYANHGDDVAEVTGSIPPNVVAPAPCMYGKVPLYECRDVPDDAYYDGRVADEAVRVLAEVRDKPFFLAVGFWKPHAPFNAPKKYWDLYDRGQLPALNDARPQGAPEIAFHDGRELRGGPPNQVTFTPEQVATIRHGYFANISYMDAQLGKVLNALEQHGLAKETIIVFAGDHGYHIGEHTLWGKTSNFELDARVPLFIEAPGIPGGKQSESLVELLDLFPTLVDLCRLPTPPGLEGQSLVPILKDPSQSLKMAAFTQHPRPAYFDRTPSGQPEVMGISVRTPQVRYTEWRDWNTGKLVGTELYEHPGDEPELINAIAEHSNSQAAVKAKELLHTRFPPEIAPSQR